MKEPNFNIGDEVWLKSGSPALTVTEKDGDRLTVSWWATEIQTTSAPAACFTKEERPTE